MRKKWDGENKIPRVSSLVTTTVKDTEVGKFKNKIPNITDLVKKASHFWC